MKWQLMTVDEVHQFGIESILPYVDNEGVVVKYLNTALGHNPQIVGTYHGGVAFVFVRTAMYPSKGELTKEEAKRCNAYARQQNAHALFASVGLACTNYPDRTDVKSDAEMRKAIKNAGYAVSYEGLAALGGH